MNRPMFGRTSNSLPSSTNSWRAARRGRRKQDVDVAKERKRRFAETPPELLRLLDPGARQHRAGDQPVAHVRVEIGRPRLQAAKMQRRASTMVMR